MLKFIKNINGIISFTFTYLALLICSGILIAAVFSFIFLNDNHIKAELKNIATSFSSIIEGIDTRFFENTTKFWFPIKEYDYKIFLSTEFIVASSKGNWNNELSCTERFLKKPWPSSLNPNWITKYELHTYLKTTYNTSGNESDPIKSFNILNVKNMLYSNRELINKSLALNPFQIVIDKPVFIEKIYIFFDKDDDGWNKEIDEKIDFVVFYQ